MANTGESKTAIFLRDTQRRLRNKTSLLRTRCENLVRDLQKTIDNCDSALAGESASINSLGEVQTAEAVIDRLCCEIGLIAEQLTQAKWLNEPN